MEGVKINFNNLCLRNAKRTQMQICRREKSMIIKTKEVYII